MTTIDPSQRQQQIQRILRLSKIAKQRYLDAGGDPHLSVGTLNNNDTLSEEERQEFLNLAHQVFTDEDIDQYLNEKGTWQERLTKIQWK
jgi:hypothetical protein